MAKSYRNKTCLSQLQASRDALEVIQGKWRLPILISLSYGSKRFGEIKKDIEDISPKMLSQELKELEMNQLISRTMYDAMPVYVEYTVTPLGKSLNKLLAELSDWGIHFRKQVLAKS